MKLAMINAFIFLNCYIIGKTLKWLYTVKVNYFYFKKDVTLKKI